MFRASCLMVLIACQCLPSYGVAQEPAPSPSPGAAPASPPDPAQPTQPAPPTQTAAPSQAPPAQTPEPAAETREITPIEASVPPPPPESLTDEQLKEEEDEDDGRRLDFLWIEGLFGYSYADLAQFSTDNFLPELNRFKGSGFVGGVAAGFRLFILTIGARGSLASYGEFDLASIMADVAVRLPVPVIEPYFRLGFGYAWMGDYGSTSEIKTDVYGLDIDGGLGLDIYLNKYFAIGGGFDAGFLNLSRQSPDDGCASDSCNLGAVDLQKSGSAVGLQIKVHGHLSVHF